MKILFVDDEVDILSSIKRQLRKESFKVVTANSASDALEILKQESFPVIISDERMPEISGLEFLKIVKELYPDSIRMILSGYADSSTIIDAINLGEIYRFISKPWKLEELKEAINKSIDKWESNKKKKFYMEQILEENFRLKKRLSFRESRLDLNQEILDELTSPVVLVGLDNCIESYNRLFADIFNDDIMVGESIMQFISSDIYSKVEKSFLSNLYMDSIEIDLNSKRYNLLARGFRPTDSYKGIIILEEDII